MQFADLNYKPHGGKICRDIIYRVIVVYLYPPTRSENYKLLHLDSYHGSIRHQTPSNDNTVNWR